MRSGFALLLLLSFAPSAAALGSEKVLLNACAARNVETLRSILLQKTAGNVTADRVEEKITLDVADADAFIDAVEEKHPGKFALRDRSEPGRENMTGTDYAHTMSTEVTVTPAQFDSTHLSGVDEFTVVYGSKKKAQELTIRLSGLDPAIRTRATIQDYFVKKMWRLHPSDFSKSELATLEKAFGDGAAQTPKEVRAELELKLRMRRYYSVAEGTTGPMQVAKISEGRVAVEFKMNTFIKGKVDKTVKTVFNTDDLALLRASPDSFARNREAVILRTSAIKGNDPDLVRATVDALEKVQQNRPALRIEYKRVARRLVLKDSRLPPKYFEVQITLDKDIRYFDPVTRAELPSPYGPNQRILEIKTPTEYSDAKMSDDDLRAAGLTDLLDLRNLVRGLKPADGFELGKGKSGMFNTATKASEKTAKKVVKEAWKAQQKAVDDAAKAAAEAARRKAWDAVPLGPAPAAISP